MPQGAPEDASLEGLKVEKQPRQPPTKRLIYRRLLAGGAAPLQLPLSGGGAILVCGLLASFLGMREPIRAVDGSWPWRAASAWTIGNAFTGLALATMAARWLGARTATLSGLVYVSSLRILMPGGVDGPISLASLAGCLAIAAFAGAEVPSRALSSDHRVSFAIFCGATAAAALMAGLAGPICILAVCLAYLTLSQDGPGLRFFTARFGLAILAGSIAAACLAAVFLGPSSGQGFLDMDTQATSVPTANVDGIVGMLLRTKGLLPWAPWILTAIAAGLRQGHYASPLGRLLIGWCLAPWTLWAVGAAPAGLAFAIFAPCAACMSAIGLAESYAWCRGVLRRPLAVPSRRARSRPA